jgi:putative transposase
VDVLGYCLMTNHVHLVMIPAATTSLAKAMREINVRYAQYRNAIERGNGHLWQSRFYSCPVDPARLGSVMRYVELNPVRARLAPAAEQFEWSSARAHVGHQDGAAVLALADWKRCWAPDEWGEILKVELEETSAIREATYGGRPLGSSQFVEDLEKFLGRRLKRGSPGRPSNKTKAVAAGEQEIN